MLFVHGRATGYGERAPGPYALLPAFDAVTVFAQTGTVHRRTLRVNRAVYHAPFFFSFTARQKQNKQNVYNY